jgi:hypothetical protein
MITMSVIITVQSLKMSDKLDQVLGVMMFTIRMDIV